MVSVVLFLNLGFEKTKIEHATPDRFGGAWHTSNFALAMSTFTFLHLLDVLLLSGKPLATPDSHADKRSTAKQKDK